MIFIFYFFKDLNLNRVIVKEPPVRDEASNGSIHKKDRKYDLAPNDRFWSQQKVRYEIGCFILCNKA